MESIQAYGGAKLKTPVFQDGPHCKGYASLWLQGSYARDGRLQKFRTTAQKAFDGNTVEMEILRISGTEAQKVAETATRQLEEVTDAFIELHEIYEENKNRIAEMRESLEGKLLLLKLHERVSEAQAEMERLEMESRRAAFGNIACNASDKAVNVDTLKGALRSACGDGMHYLGFVTNGSYVGHAMALQIVGQTALFFDANTGEWVVPSAKLNLFFQDYMSRFYTGSTWENVNVVTCASGAKADAGELKDGKKESS
jgi:hypothetical protein